MTRFTRLALLLAVLAAPAFVSGCSEETPTKTDTPPAAPAAPAAPGKEATPPAAPAAPAK